MNMDIEARAKQVMTELFAACDADEQGRSRIDGGRVTDIVRRDKEAVSFVVQKIMTSPLANKVGWGIWMATAAAFESEYDDDSLTVLVQAAAEGAGEKLPGIVSSTATVPDNRDKLVVLEMAEADVAAGDASRMLMILRLENISAELQERLIGKCIITFPAEGDDRPVQHIPRIRAFVADLHRRMPYFPIFLDFDDRLAMRQMYFGCLADTQATEVMPDGQVATNLGHPSALEAVQSAVVGIVHACSASQIDWRPCVEAILAPYGPALRSKLIREA